MRVAAVVQRYGATVAGGAERLAREVCTRLAAGGDEVTVLTTTARDYVTWRNELPAGAADDTGVAVRRFAVASEREPDAFQALSARVFREGAMPTLEDELGWIRAQGPDSPGLLAALWRERTLHDAWLFFTYLYAPTALGVPIAPQRAVLVPLAHNEAPIYLRTFKNLFRLPRALLFQTPEEQELVERVVPRNTVRGEVVGCGVDLAPASAPEAAWPASVPPGARYLLYLGRLDPSKGVGELLDAFASWRATRGGALALVLAGEAAMELHAAQGVVVPGFVSEDERDRLLAHAEVVIQPSRFESLSLVALEAWARGRAVLGQRGSDVLVGQIGRSGGGFVWGEPAELHALLDRLAAGDAAFAEAGRAGRRFVEATGSWERVIERYRAALVTAASGAPRAA
ncbi:MAG: glycosyltransferase family 4 protein [Deltaproteobacteria bacterium]|nr:glycosyltransferase family 4 protein [Deltaproteobacteria bacterium]